MAARAPRGVTHTSSYSGGNGNCVTVRHTGDAVHIGDSKRPDATPLRCAPAHWTSFVTATTTGRLAPRAPYRTAA